VITPHSDGVAGAIKRGIEDAIKQIIEKEVKEASARIESKVRESVGQITTRVLNRFTMQQMGSELVIRVDIHEPGVIK
jgi:hypothetical protein